MVHKHVWRKVAEDAERKWRRKMARRRKKLEKLSAKADKIATTERDGHQHDWRPVFVAYSEAIIGLKCDCGLEIKLLG